MLIGSCGSISTIRACSVTTSAYVGEIKVEDSVLTFFGISFGGSV